ncbi:efflux transporter, outer membrane factor (OMF) lipoprotein, NodT family [Methylomagnum ishizawai]|uniref:Efflux transporter, outer membrane factor (OMF) lipoprotein, NodT family n=1 Tax=Methylomagnum ishizawai TaxID=1760988 RepID=A0A1Y6D9P7_9GAMM|nr:efflux transporter outer membrane subunit [Methylomagnum ishizawai]SMF97102.1 efflux transporter, outer membrane factor (OMF) lipoprotein, NodT family [Methylomagnum ishizawai]
MNPRRLSLLLVGVLAGCTVGPDYQRPKTPTPSHWREATAQTTAPATEWWKAFNDPVLDRLIRQALAENLDLKQTTTRIADARAQGHAVIAGALPSLDAHNSTSRRLNNFSSSGGSGSSGSAAGSGLGVGKQIVNIFQTGFDAEWELDFFGGVQRAFEAAEASLDAEEENRRAVVVSLLGEVARQYIEVRANQRQIAITQDNLRAQTDTLALTRARERAGLATGLEVSQQEAQVATTRAQLPVYATGLKQALHALAVLLGKAPAELAELPGAAAQVPNAAPGLVADLPSELLRRRPDIRKSERQLAAANAQVGVAISDLYPKVNLSAFIGIQNTHITDFTPIGKSWSMASSISLPIFNWGRIQANIDSKQAQHQQAFLSYQSTVLNAFKEVEDALAAYTEEQRRRADLAEAVEASRLAMNLAEERYERGLTTFLDVLETQRALYTAESSLVASQAQVSTGLVALYKALGGGWQVAEPDRAGTEQASAQ